PDAKDVNSECVFFDDSLNVVDTKHSIYNQAIGIYRPHYEYFAVHPETDKVYLISDVSFPAFNGNPQIRSDIYMSQFNPDFTQTKFKLGPYTLDEYDQIALCEAIDFHEENIFMCGYMNTMFGGNAPDTDNFYVAMLDGNLNIVGEIYYHNVERMVVPYSILVLESGDCLVSTAGKDRKSGEMQHAIFKLSHAIFDGIEEAHDAGFALAIAYPNPGKDVLNIRTGLKDARVEVYDMNGRILYRQEITDNITIINTSYWSSGTYMWTVVVDGKVVESGKWIKE
ncbi:MAG: T9SS type A sorting domain-containing protein, partial [Bacteroidales bacterium]|nr:T9SS type A sorting domain-containing protein [Bacteroidales bacterium]